MAVFCHRMLPRASLVGCVLRSGALQPTWPPTPGAPPAVRPRGLQARGHLQPQVSQAGPRRWGVAGGPPGGGGLPSKRPAGKTHRRTLQPRRGSFGAGARHPAGGGPAQPTDFSGLFLAPPAGAGYAAGMPAPAMPTATARTRAAALRLAARLHAQGYARAPALGCARAGGRATGWCWRRRPRRAAAEASRPWGCCPTARCAW